MPSPGLLQCAPRWEPWRSPLFDIPEEMTITHTDAEIVVLEKDGRLRVLHPDGRKRTSEAGEVKARWDEKRLVVETAQIDSLHVTETFSVAAGRREIDVEVSVSGQPSVTVRRVYELQREEWPTVCVGCAPTCRWRATVCSTAPRRARSRRPAPRSPAPSRPWAPIGGAPRRSAGCSPPFPAPASRTCR
jgi:hypothetical protein